MTLQSKNPETMVLHAGPRSDAATGAVAVPISRPRPTSSATPSMRRTCSR